MIPKKFKCIEQEVIHGRKTIKIGYRRNVVREFEKLRKSTYDTIIFEDIPVLRGIDTCIIDGVKTLVLKDIGLLDDGIFAMRDLETLIICGTIGQLRPWVVSYCDNLRTIIIDANVFSCDSYLFFNHCPKLTHVIVRGTFPDNFIHVTDDTKTYFDNYTRNVSKFPFENYRKSFNHMSDEQKLKVRERLLQTSKWVTRHYAHNQELDDAIGTGAWAMWDFIADAFGSRTRAYKLREIGWEYNQEKDNPSVKSLKRSGEYTPGENPLKYSFSYAPEETEVFQRNRRRFHLRKIAGKGPDYIRMMRLCRWVHESIRHDGKAIPHVYYNLQCLMDATARIGMPGNCFVMAMCLSEALLSVGIKAKYIKGYPLINGLSKYHVFVAAWSRYLKKWIFLDPTYGAWVRGMDGKLLSPAEIRHNLIHDIPMHLNQDADYNGNKESAKTYLSHYLAPYMHYMVANTYSQDETEGDTHHPQGRWVTLVPKGGKSDMFFYNPTTDDEYFWQPISEIQLTLPNS